MSVCASRQGVPKSGLNACAERHRRKGGGGHDEKKQQSREPATFHIENPSVNVELTFKSRAGSGFAAAKGLTRRRRRPIYRSNAYRKIESGPRGARFFVRKGPVLGLLEDRLTDLIAPIAEATGFELIRVRVTGGKTKTLQVMAERADHTMTAEDCAALSRALSPILDEADPIEDNYNLEVSSPGIDRPLVRLKDFEDWRGWPAKLELNRLVEGRKRFSGAVAGVDDGMVAFDIEGEDETALFPLEWIASAKLVLTDELIRESLKAGKAQLENAGTVGEGDEEMTETIHERG
jgi:ribosome maturation factor RimP